MIEALFRLAETDAVFWGLPLCAVLVALIVELKASNSRGRR